MALVGAMLIHLLVSFRSCVETLFIVLIVSISHHGHSQGVLPTLVIHNLSLRLRTEGCFTVHMVWVPSIVVPFVHI